MNAQTAADLRLLNQSTRETSFPQGPFDAEGEWRRRYSIDVIWRRGKGSASVNSPSKEKAIELKIKPDGGSLAIERRRADDAIRYSVEYRLRMTGGDESVEIGEIIEKPDASNPLVSWTQRFQHAPKNASMAPLAAVEQTVEWNDGALRIDGQPAPERHAARAARSEWGLFDSIASIAASGQKETPPFDMLESCSIWRTEQRILRRDWIELASAGGPMRVLDCVQIGRGIQPRHYYLDEHQRLVVVSDFFRIYQLIEEAPLGTGKKGAER